MQEIIEKTAKALILAKKAWEKANMPLIYENVADETGKVALAILASRILDKLVSRL